MQNKKAKRFGSFKRENNNYKFKEKPTLEEFEKYLEEIFINYKKPNSRQILLNTGRGGAIMSVNALRTSMNLAKLTAEEESSYREGFYETTNESYASYKGYPFESADGFRVVKEYGHWYLDEVIDNWAYQVVELTEEEAQELIKMNK